MYKLILINEKGGVGKTTLSLHIAQGLATRGRRVMLVDSDSQGHSTVRCKVPKSPGLYDLLVRDGDWRRLAREIPQEQYGIVGDSLLQQAGKLYLLPSNVETRTISGAISEADLFRDRLNELEDFIDVVVIDTSPTPSLLHGVIYTAADAAIYPTKLTYTSFDGLIEAIHRREKANKARAQFYKLNPIELLGIVPVEYRSTTNEQKYHLEKLREEFAGKVWNPIPQATAWTEAESAAVPVWNIHPNSDAATHAWELIDRVEEAMHVKV